MRRTLLAFVLLAAACSKETPKETPKPAPDAAPPPSLFDGHAVVVSTCLSCHTEDMLKQQRLTAAQWGKVVPKMVTWGATLEPQDVTPLVAYLAAEYGPDAGPWEPTPVAADEAIKELVPADDGPIPKGDPEKGKAVYLDKCSGCHGEGARGHIGVNLVERPILYHAKEFAYQVRRSGGKMTPIPLDDAQMGDVLAHLRRLRIPPP